MTTNAVFLVLLGFFKGVLLSVRPKKGFQQFEKRSAPFFPFPFPPPPQTFFSKTLLFFIISCLFFFFCHHFQHSMFFVINPFSDIILVLFLWPYEQTALKDLFREHFFLPHGLKRKDLRGRTPICSFQRLSAPGNLISISVINAQGLTKGWFSKRVVLADKILDLLLVFFFLVFSAFWFGETMVVFLCNSSNPLERPFCFFDSVLSSFFFLPFLSLLLSFKASSIASPFPNPSFLHLGPPGFSVVGVLIVVFFISVFFGWSSFFLFVSVVLLWDYDNKRRFPLQFWVFSKGVLV